MRGYPIIVYSFLVLLKVIYSFLAVLCFHCYVRTFSVMSRACSVVVVHGLLLAAASLAAEHGL